MPEVKQSLIMIAKLRMQLIPYIYESAKQAQQTGLPLTRHLILDFS